MEKCTIFSGFTKPVEDKLFEEILADIRSDKYKIAITEIRRFKDQNNKEEVDKLKKQLLAFTPSGVFSGGRKLEFLKSHTGLIHLDFDKLSKNQLDSIRDRAKLNEFVRAFFVSPSGNGIKLFVEADASEKSHSTIYKNVEDYFEHILGFRADPACKDITRLCFVSHDPDAYYNSESRTFEIIESKHDQIEQDNNAFNDCVLQTESRSRYNEGNRNNFIHSLACNCNRKGISYDNALQKILNKYDLPTDEIETAVRSAYGNVGQFGINQKSLKTTESELIELVTYTRENTPTIDDNLFLKLPYFLSKGCRAFDDKRERDVFFTGALSILSGCLPNVSGVYARERVFPNLFAFIVAPAASGKGALKFAKVLADKYQERTLKESKEAKASYEAELEQYKTALKLSKKNNCEAPEEPMKPEFEVVFIPANTSSAAILAHLNQNEGKGIMCETEADSMGAAFKQDWGGYSDMLRKAFHHETISVTRKTDNEYLEIRDTKLSVALSGTPGQVAGIISSSEDGLFSRFMFYTFSVKPIWKDVSPYSNAINLNDHFEKLSIGVLDMVDFLESHPTKILLSKEMWQEINSIGQEWLTDVTIFTAEEAGSVAKRLGIILYRICMVFTALRKFDDGDCTEGVSCSDEDFETALSVTKLFLEHSLIMYTNLPKKEELGVFKAGSNKKQFYDFLPKEFTRDEAISLSKNFGLKTRSVDGFLKTLLEANYLSKPSYGHYKKVSK